MEALIGGSYGGMWDLDRPSTRVVAVAVNTSRATCRDTLYKEYVIVKYV